MKNDYTKRIKQRLITIRELAEYTGFSISNLYSRISKKQIPYVKIGHSVRFDLEKIDEWISEQSVEPEKAWKH